MNKTGQRRGVGIDRAARDRRASCWMGAAPAIALAACGAAEEPPSRELYELERLSFVPPARCELASFDLSVATAIVIDRYEFTRADLAHYWPDHERRAAGVHWPGDVALAAPERADWPAFVDFHEAGELAALRGMRLPTPREWLHVAVGRRDYQKPWGGSGREYFANTQVVQDGQDFSLNSPCCVGTFENGRSRPFGCYDLLGNVWEWVDGIVLGCIPALDPLGRGVDEVELDDLAGTMTSVMGGAYNTAWRPTYELDRSLGRPRFYAWRVEKGSLSPSIGARMCADAEPYLLSMAGRWGSGEAARRRIRDVGQRWARDDALARAELRTLLAQLRARPGAPPALAWLEEGVLAEP